MRILGTHTHAHKHSHTHTHTYIYIYIYIYIYNDRPSTSVTDPLFVPICLFLCSHPFHPLCPWIINTSLVKINGVFFSLSYLLVSLYQGPIYCKVAQVFMILCFFYLHSLLVFLHQGPIDCKVAQVFMIKYFFSLSSLYWGPIDCDFAQILWFNVFSLSFWGKFTINWTLIQMF